MSEENATNALVPVPAVPTVIQAVNPFAQVFGVAERPMFTSFDVATPEGRELIQKCDEEQDESVRSMANMKFNLAHFYGRVIDYTNKETGETYPLLRICLITDEGKVHACCSDGIREALVRLVASRKGTTFKPPIPVQIKLKDLDKGRQRLTLLEVFDKKGAKK